MLGNYTSNIIMYLLDATSISVLFVNSFPSPSFVKYFLIKPYIKLRGRGDSIEHLSNYILLNGSVTPIYIFLQFTRNS